MTKEPEKLLKIKDPKDNGKLYWLFRENGQRNFISKGLKSANDNNILISDVDEIPNLKNINF